jgi:hypothetical protein
MKALFWNIGATLTDKKLKLISNAITSESPDIFCIAEGSPKKSDCQTIVDTFLKQGYNCYYSPLFSKKPELKLDYTNYEKYGLKIFVKDNKILKEEFSFSYQRMGGRIIVVKTYINFRPTTFIFLHSKSKSGSDETTKEQHAYILKLRDMIDKDVGKITDNKDNSEIMGSKERVIIMGDFNVEPWEKVLNSKYYLTTSFFRNHNSMKQRKNNKDSIYFNPIVEHIFHTKIENLGGTFYSKNHGWALFDFILYDTKDGEISYNILTELKGGTKLLNEATTIKKTFLNEGLDHLPILTEIIDKQKTLTS